MQNSFAQSENAAASKVLPLTALHGLYAIFNLEYLKEALHENLVPRCQQVALVGSVKCLWLAVKALLGTSTAKGATLCYTKDLTFEFIH